MPNPTRVISDPVPPEHFDWTVDESGLRVCDCPSCRAARAKALTPTYANEVFDIVQWSAEHPDIHSCEVCGDDWHCTRQGQCDGSCFDILPQGYDHA